MTTPETLEYKDPINDHLNKLKKWVVGTAENKEFRELTNNPVLQTWLDKLYNGVCLKAFSEEWKTFETMNIWEKISDILKKYPSLLLEISWPLELPLSETKFSNLSLQQKLNFMSLYQAVYYKGFFNKKNPSVQDIKDRMKRYNIAIEEKINSSFALENNIKNLWDIEKTLKKYGLTSDEIWKVKEYILFLKKHPKCAEAGGRWWFITWLILWVLSTLWVIYVKDVIRGKPEIETNVWHNGVTTIGEPQNVLKLITQEAEFQTPTDSISVSPKVKWWFYDFLEENRITGNFITKPVTKKVLELYKEAQTRTISMHLEWKYQLQFNLDDKNSKIDINATDWKWEIFVQLPLPKLVAIDTKATVENYDREIIQVDAYNQAQEDLRKMLEDKAISDGEKADFYQNWTSIVAEQLFGLFSTIYKPAWLEITGVYVRFFDPEKDTPRDRDDWHPKDWPYRDWHPINWPMPVETEKKE